MSDTPAIERIRQAVRDHDVAELPEALGRWRAAVLIAVLHTTIRSSC